MNEEYNGWSNWATWNMNLWIINDYSAVKAVERQAEVFTTLNTFLEEGLDVVDVAEASRDLGDWLEEEFGQHATPDMGPRDMHHVNWREIAEGWLG